MTLHITPAQGSDGSLHADFDFYAVAANPGVPSGSGRMQGAYTAGHLTLTWQTFTTQPAGYRGISLSGSLSNSGNAQTLSGTVTPVGSGSGCTTFSLTRTSPTGASSTG